MGGKGAGYGRKERPNELMIFTRRRRKRKGFAAHGGRHGVRKERKEKRHAFFT